jgi:uncharacterized protein
MARAADLLGMERRQADAFRDLERGQFIALGPALSRRPLGLRIGPTATQPRSGTPRLVPLPETMMEDPRAIILASAPSEIRRVQRKPASDLMDQLAAAREALESIEQPLSDEEQANRRGRLDNVLSAILAEPDAGFRTVGVLYQEFVVRCRIEGLGSAVPGLSEFRRILTCARAGITSEMTESGEWHEVSVRAAILPEDIQGVFLMMARAAREGLPCPSDAAIARAYGTHSLRRARRALTYIEEQGLLVCEIDGTGRRVVTLSTLLWATAPGEPNGDDAPSPNESSDVSLL